MTVRAAFLAIAALALLAGCGGGVEGTYCIADAGKIVLKGGRARLDTGEAAGTYTVDSADVVTFTNKFGAPQHFLREKDGVLNGVATGGYRMTPCK
jgi:hypothetical protein